MLGHYPVTEDAIRRAIRIVVPGEPKGYRVARNRGWSKEQRVYRIWRDSVCEAFKKAGVSCPTFADYAYPLFVHTRAFYSSRCHCDPGNTNKGLIDAIFYGSKGTNDKYVGGCYDAPLYDKENPRTEVELRGWILKKYPELVTSEW